mgnify:FL=1
MRPYAILFSTMTVDGRIADPTGYSRLSCEEDFDLLHALRSWADGVLVGARTVALDNPSLTVRRQVGRNPIRIVLDGSLTTPPTSRVFDVPGRAVLITRKGHEEGRLNEYRRRGVIVIEEGRQEVDLRAAFARLYEIGVRRLLVEGGGTTAFSLLNAGLLDEIWVTVAPYVFAAGTPVVDGKGLGIRASLYLREVRTLCGGWVNLRYGIVSPRAPLTL